MKINRSIFREYDIRGIAGKEITTDLARSLGMAYSITIKKEAPKPSGKYKVSVGRDCRLSSDEIAGALIDGLISGGLDVVSLGTCPTPLTYFSIPHLKLDGGIMITGSHNAAEYNGFKTCIGASTIHGTQIQDLGTLIEKLDSAFDTGQKKGVLESYEIIEPYIDYVAKNIKLGSKPIKVVLDAGNGTAGNVAPPLFEKLGATVVPLYCDLDGNFPNHHPDPTVPENLKDLVKKVKEEKADFGVGFDGDSDRIGLIDETGRVIFGDELMVIFSRSILLKNPGATIISEVKSSHRLYQDIAEKGGKPIMWKTGHSLIKAKMKEENAALAGEMSGHIFFADRYFGFDDAIYAAARVLEIATENDGPVSSLISDLTPMVATPEIRIDCDEDKKFQLVEEAKKGLKSHNVNDIDGVRIDFPDGWGLLRASNTQPALVMRFEAPTQARLDEIRTLVESSLKKAAVIVGHSPLL